MRYGKEAILDKIKGSLIVSCQALPGEPLYVEEKSVMYLMARAAKQAGIKCIRTNGVRDVIAIKEETGLPVIGLIKQVYDNYEPYITPTMKEVDALVDAGTDIIALDCTDRKRGDGLCVREWIHTIRKRHRDILLMADISTYEEGVEAWKSGVDFVGTTMSGYTSYSPQKDGPDYELVQRLSQTVDIPVIGEGKVHYPQEAVKMLEAGAYAVVVGGAITRPLEIAQRFMAAIEAEKNSEQERREHP